MVPARTPRLRSAAGGGGHSAFRVVASLVLGLLVALCLAGRVLAQEQPGPDLEVLCTPMKKKACRLEDLCVWQGRRGGCEAATNICPAIQARKNGQSKRMRCQDPTNSTGIQGVCQCRRRKGRCGPCRSADADESGPRGGEDCWPGGTIVGPFCNFGSQNCCGACIPGELVSYCCPRGKEVCYKPGRRGAMKAYCSHCLDGVAEFCLGQVCDNGTCRC